LQSIFHYTQYRLYLSDYYTWAKKNLPGFSHRAFLAKAGMSGPNYLKKVMEGHHNLTPESTSKFIQALALPDREAEYFRALVNFNQAKTLADKDLHFERLIKLKAVGATARLEQSQYRYYKDWWVVALRELLAFYPYHEKPEQIHQYLVPPITPKQAESAINLLLELGLVQKNLEGRLCQTTQGVSTDPHLRSLLLEKFHRSTAQLALEALDTFSPEDIRLSSVTMSIDQDTFHKIILKIREFRKEVLNLALQVPTPDRVMHLNMQLFPMSRIKPRQVRKKRKIETPKPKQGL